MKRTKTPVISAIVILVLALSSYSQDQVSVSSSLYPVAVDMSLVGEYPSRTKSGAGYFYDEVLEYRVWVDHEDGDYYHAFATYEDAKAFSATTKNAEEPLVLVMQHEYINEPEPGKYEHAKGDRITEWLVEWLDGNKRGPDTIRNFLLEHSDNQLSEQTD